MCTQFVSILWSVWESNASLRDFFSQTLPEYVVIRKHVEGFDIVILSTASANFVPQIAVQYIGDVLCPEQGMILVDPSRAFSPDIAIGAFGIDRSEHASSALHIDA